MKTLHANHDQQHGMAIEYLLAHYKNVKTIVNYYKDAKSYVFSHAAEISILLGYDATIYSFPSFLKGT